MSALVISTAVLIIRQTRAAHDDIAEILSKIEHGELAPPMPFPGFWGGGLGGGGLGGGLGGGVGGAGGGGFGGGGEMGFGSGYFSTPAAQP